MRENNYISMMDPFQIKYGKKLTAALAVVPVMAEIIWIPGLLIALGTQCASTLKSTHIKCRPSPSHL